MHSDGLKENYYKNLDEIIEFFKTIKETKTFYLYIGKEDNNFERTTLLSITALILAGFFSLLNIDSVKTNSESWNFILIIIAVCLFISAIGIFFFQKCSKEFNHKILDETININIKLNFFQSLKLQPYELDLSEIIKKIEFYNHLDTIPSKKDEKYFSETWNKEINDCLNEINKEILEIKKNTPL